MAKAGPHRDLVGVRSGGIEEEADAALIPVEVILA